MANVIKFYNNNLQDENENLYLHFDLGESKYAISVQQVVEIMKLPLLDYPQKLANNVVGLLNYNNFTINILDLRFYLDVKVTPYSISNQLLVVKTDESIFGLIVDAVDDIIPLDPSKVEYFPFSGEDKIIDFLYKRENKTTSVINLSAVEEILKHGVPSCDIDVPSLFPQDDSSRYKLVQRTQALLEKFEQNAVSNIFSQDKFISFSLNNSLYCMQLECVREFLKNYTITKIPCDLDYISGVITFRGDFVAIIDLKKFMEIESADSYSVYNENKNSIITIETPDFKMGFLVDKIFSIIEIPEELINKNSYKRSKYILSEVMLEDKLYTVLNIKNILSDERLFIEDSIT